MFGLDKNTSGQWIVFSPGNYPISLYIGYPSSPSDYKRIKELRDNYTCNIKGVPKKW